MLKQLGTFVVLAVCLFAIAMVGCDREDPPPDKPIELPPEETPQQKLAGSYDLVSGSINSELVPGITGNLTLHEYTDAWSMEFSAPDADFRASGVLWRATELTIKFIYEDGSIENVPYRWIGERLETEFPYGEEIIILTWEDSFP